MFAGIKLVESIPVSQKDYLTKVQCATDNSTIVVGSSSGSIDFVDSNSLQKTLSLSQGHRSNVTDIQPFLNMRDCYVSTGYDGFAYVWDCRERKSEPAQKFKIGNKKSNDCYSVTVNLDGSILAAGYGNDVLIFDVRTANKELTLLSHYDTVQCTRFHPLHRNVLITGAEDGLINFFNTDTFTKNIHTFEDEQKFVEEEINVPAGVANTTEGVRTFELIGDNLEALCCFTLGECVQVHLTESFAKVIETDAVRAHPSLAYEESFGYAVSPLYCKDTGRLFVLGGSSAGALRIFHVNAQGADEGISLEVPSSMSGKGHTDVVRSAVRVSNTIYSVAEDGLLCVWKTPVAVSLNGNALTNNEEDMMMEEEDMGETKKKLVRPY